MATKDGHAIRTTFGYESLLPHKTGEMDSEAREYVGVQ